MHVYKATFNYSSLCWSVNQPDADNSNKLYLFFILAAIVLRQIFINSGYKGRETKGSNCFYCVFATTVSLCKSSRTLCLYLACNAALRSRGTGNFNCFSFYPLEVCWSQFISLLSRRVAKRHPNGYSGSFLAEVR